LLNNWIVAGAKAAESSAVSVSGSVGVNLYMNKSKALVEGGAELNQDSAHQNDEQSVKVDAKTAMQLIEVAGIGKWSLSESPIGKKIDEKKKWGELLRGGDFIDIFGRSGSKALGGSILVTAIENDTIARIEPGAKVHVGSEGSLTIKAYEDILRIAIAQSGG